MKYDTEKKRWSRIQKNRQEKKYWGSMGPGNKTFLIKHLIKTARNLNKRYLPKKGTKTFPDGGGGGHISSHLAGDASKGMRESGKYEIVKIYMNISFIHTYHVISYNTWIISYFICFYKLNLHAAPSKIDVKSITKKMKSYISIQEEL